MNAFLKSSRKAAIPALAALALALAIWWFWPRTRRENFSAFTKRKCVSWKDGNCDKWECPKGFRDYKSSNPARECRQNTKTKFATMIWKEGRGWRCPGGYRSTGKKGDRECIRRDDATFGGGSAPAPGPAPAGKKCEWYQKQEADGRCTGCPPTQVWDGNKNQCVCPQDFQTYDSERKQCTGCPPGTAWKDNECKCTARNQIYDSNQKKCDCRSGTKWDGANCVELWMFD